MQSEPMIEKYVGAKMKERRKTLKLSQMQLAELMGLSYQQIQKYESGVNKFTLNRLLQLAKVLNTSPSYFYDGAKVDFGIGTEKQSELIKNVRTRPLSILLVEDNAGDIMLFEKAVKNSEHPVDVYTIKDSHQVMDFLGNHEAKYGRRRPDIMMLDINMPKIDGLTLLKQIKKNQTLTDIPIIMMTHSVNTREMSESYKLNASGFIQKAQKYEDYCKNLVNIVNYWSDTVILPDM